MDKVKVVHISKSNFTKLSNKDSNALYFVSGEADTPSGGSYTTEIYVGDVMYSRADNVK